MPSQPARGPEMRGLLFAMAALAGLASPARADDLFSRDNLSGDWGGLRSNWQAAGLFVGGDEILDAFANPSGGANQGGVFNGRLELFLTADLGTLAGWNGTLLHANAYLIHGHGLSADRIGNLLTVDNIAATPATRLFAVWVQQSFLDDTVSLRAGQLAADDEFFVSQYATLFVNSAFGWPSILGVNLPSGGPAYPLATPGARLRVAIQPGLIVSIGLFNGDPAPAGHGDPQRRDGDGLRFRGDGDAFLIGEMTYATVLGHDALPGSYKLGGWFHSGDFADHRRDASGLPLADPTSSGIAALHAGNYGAYLIANQLLWRTSATSDRGLGFFFRLGAAPGDRNLIAWHLDAGLSYAGLLPGRDNDTVGVGFSHERVGSGERGLARDAAALAGHAVPMPDCESALELSYQMQVAPWWILQPDIQWIFHPGARLYGAPTLADAAVLGLRTAINL